MTDNKIMQERLIQISKETGLPVKKVIDMLSYLKESNPIENNELLRRLGVSRNILNQIKDKLSGFFEPPSESTSILNPKICTMG